MKRMIQSVILVIAVVLLVFSISSCDWLLGIVDPLYDAGGTLIISEVGSCPFTNITSWFELYNDSALDASLNTFTIKTYGRDKVSTYDFQGVTTFSLPALTIPPGSYAVVRGATSSDLVNGGMIVYIENSGVVPNWVWDGSSTGQGFIELVKGGQTVDFVRWGGNSVEPASIGNWGVSNADALPTGYIDPPTNSKAYYGHSIARNAANTDTNTNSDWTARDFATPGGPNDVTSNIDSDNDGIPDCSETDTNSTFAGLPLFDWGASVGTRDIFVHIDYMDSTDPGITPLEDALDNVKAAFVASGTNLRIHFDVGVLYTAYNMDGRNHQVPYHQSTTLGAQSNYSNVYEYKNSYMPLAKRQIFHYMLFANSQNPDGSGGSSGLAEINGNDVLIALGGWGLAASPTSEYNRLVNYQASTLMHELGHNLGLLHGGDENDNYKPNYLSIMNYLHQLNGLPTPGNSEGDRYKYNRWNVGLKSDLTNSPYTLTFKMDYSHGLSGTLDEDSLDESNGFMLRGAGGPFEAVDLNDDSDTGDSVGSGLANPYDIDDYEVGETSSTADGDVTDYDDWANIYLFFQRNWSGDTQGVTETDGPMFVTDVIGDDRQEIYPEPPIRYKD